MNDRNENGVMKNILYILTMCITLLYAPTFASAITSAEVATHNVSSNCWIIISGDVYGVTAFIPIHPGGNAIVPYCGRDATIVFDNIHSPSTEALLPTYLLGPLTTASPVLTTVMLSPLNQSIEVGGYAQLTASPKDQNGASIAVDSISWSSSNNSVAIVNSSGGVTGISAGSALISARANADALNATGQITVFVGVAPIIPGSMTIVPSAEAIFTGGQVQLTATVKDASNNIIPAVVAWITSDSGIATVSSNGSVRGISEGQVVITGTTGSGTQSLMDSSVITVAARRTYSIAKVAEHNSRTDCWFIVGGRVFDITNIIPIHPGGDNNLVPFCGSDASMAFYDSNHRPTAGYFLLTEFLQGDLTPTPKIASIETLSSILVLNGSTKQIKTTPLNQFGGLFIPSSRVWTSSDESIAKVNASGAVTGVNPGNTTVKLRAIGANNYSEATIAVMVSDALPVLTKIEVSPMNAAVSIGGESQFKASVLDQYGNLLVNPITWSSTAVTIGTVNSSGGFKGIASGTTRVRASSGNVSGDATAVVSAPYLASVDVQPIAFNMLVGSNGTVTATPRDQSGRLFSGAQISWKTTDSGIVSVEKGFIRAIGSGYAHVTVRATAGGKTAERSVLVVVSDMTATEAEVAKHNTMSDCWMIFNGKIYDATTFGPIHPGGETLYPSCGTEATDIFRSIHVNGQRLVNYFYIGDVRSVVTPSTNQSDCKMEDDGRFNCEDEDELDEDEEEHGEETESEDDEHEDRVDRKDNEDRKDDDKRDNKGYDNGEDRDNKSEDNKDDENEDRRRDLDDGDGLGENLTISSNMTWNYTLNRTIVKIK